MIIRYGCNTAKLMSYPLQDIVLIQMADGHRVTAQESLDWTLEAANRNTESICYKTLARIHRYGVTDSFVKTLNDWLSHTSMIVRPQFDVESRSIIWAVDQDSITNPPYDEDYVSTDEEFLSEYAWQVAALIGIGALDNLKRCKDCRNFYIGGPRAKWCSNTCGSRNRARNKRTRDSEAGNYESRYL